MMQMLFHISVQNTRFYFNKNRQARIAMCTIELEYLPFPGMEFAITNQLSVPPFKVEYVQHRLYETSEDKYPPLGIYLVPVRLGRSRKPVSITLGPEWEIEQI